MPAYLTTAEYLVRYGTPETIQLTDETGAGTTVNTAVLTAAINDGEDVVNSYLAAKYTLPLSADPTTAPTIVKGIVAALARENLFRARPLPAVTEAADRARTMLRDLSAGRSTLLGIDEQQAPASATPSAAEIGPIADRTVFTNDAMDRFSGFGGPL